ncbi:MAG: HRDC domain-containing protein [Bacteroidota bacterium]
MQIRIFSIPLPGSDKETHELNTFLRSKKVLKVESELVQSGQEPFWCFCVRYVDTASSPKKEKKVDYKEVLDADSFARFSAYRVIRKRIADEEGIPAYAVFYNNELAELAKAEKLTLAKMKKIEGIGPKRIEKYGKFFISASNETI